MWKITYVRHILPNGAPFVEAYVTRDGKLVDIWSEASISVEASSGWPVLTLKKTLHPGQDFVEFVETSKEKCKSGTHVYVGKASQCVGCRTKKEDLNDE